MSESDASTDNTDDDDETTTDRDLVTAAADDEQRQAAEAEDDDRSNGSNNRETDSDYDDATENHDGKVEEDDEEPSTSADDDERVRPKPIRRKVTNRTKKYSKDMLKQQDCLRRSERSRKEVQRFEIGNNASDSDEKSLRARKRPRNNSDDWNDSDSSGSDQLSDDDSSRKRKSTIAKNYRNRPSMTTKKRNHRTTSDDDDDDDDESDTSNKRRSARRRRNKATNRVDYRDVDSDNDIDDDDVLEWQQDDDGGTGAGTDPVVVDTSETIERVMRHRIGRPTAVGHATTFYNVEANGDPNAGFATNTERGERQFLIKWVGWSHLHNTWESDASLQAINARGMKKVENYVKRMREIEDWRRTADKEYIEYFDCEQEMSEELCEQYKIAERVIAHQVNRERSGGDTPGNDYYVKWCGLPYSECTWEDAALISKWYKPKIDAYHERLQTNRIPSRTCQLLRRRPKFQKFDEMPEYLTRVGSDQELRDYQLEGLNWMLHAWCKNNSCILADEMGLGKTIQAIAFLSTQFHHYDLYGPYLVVVPLSTMAAWQREFENWADDMNVIVYMGDVVSRNYIRQFEWYVQGTKRLIFNVVLTTYEILLKDKAFLGSFDWAVLAVDEAHRLKNDDSLLYRSLFAFSTNHRLLITGTPLQNSLKELWALLHFIMPDRFSSWAEFEEQHKETDHRGFASLHRQLEPYLLRRVKKDVEKSLPAKVEQILRVDMTAHQKQFYKWILTKNYKELSQGVKGSINGFINLVMELKKCCNHASLVRAPDTIYTDAQAHLQQLLKSSGKLILLDKLLCRLHATGHRVLIFSQMVMMLDILHEYLQLRRFPSQRLDGSMRSDLRKQALDHFNAEGSSDFCFLLSTRAGGLGINLATADTVIIFDSDWNPQNDLQAMSRAHRIGQKKQVNIYRLVTKGSVEEDIVERAKQKLVLDHLVIQRMDTTGKTVLSKNAVSATSGNVPFDRQELSAILKFGAEELFKEKAGEEAEPEVDIDNILQGAETRECDHQEAASELLSAFKVANFAINEEEDIAALNHHQPSAASIAAAATRAANSKQWDEIIPEAERRKIEEQERTNADLLFLGPRQRNKVQQMARGEDSDDEEWNKSAERKKKKSASKTGDGGVNSDMESSGDDSDEDRPRSVGRKKRTVLFGFSEMEIRKFVRSFRKFAMPMQRLEAIAQDAELEDHSTGELAQLGEELLRGCDEAAKEYERNGSTQLERRVGDDGKRKQDRGPVFRLGGVDVYVRPLRKVQADLEPLSMLVPKERQLISTFRIPGRPRPQKGWDVSWEDEDDSALLRGIHLYGMGSWDAIKMDPDLGLVDKIWLKDKNKKPQAKHIQARADYLLKYLAKHVDIKKIRHRQPTKPTNNTVDVNDGAIIKDPKKVIVQKKELLLKAKKRKKERETKKRDEVEEGEIDDEHPVRIIKPSTNRTKKVEKPLLTAKTDHLFVNMRYIDDLSNQNSKQFLECIQAMRPVQKVIKKFVTSELLDSTESIRNLLKVGDHMAAYLADKATTTSASAAILDKWHSYLWIFLSRFTKPIEDPNKLLQLYRDAVKLRNANPNIMIEQPSHHHHHHHHHHQHGKHHKNDVKPSVAPAIGPLPKSDSTKHRNSTSSSRPTSSATREGYRRPDEKSSSNSHRYNVQPNAGSSTSTSTNYQHHTIRRMDDTNWKSQKSHGTIDDQQRLSRRYDQQMKGGSMMTDGGADSRSLGQSSSTWCRSPTNATTTTTSRSGDWRR